MYFKRKQKLFFSSFYLCSPVSKPFFFFKLDLTQLYRLGWMQPDQRLSSWRHTYINSDWWINFHLHSNEGNYACNVRRAYPVQRRGLMLGEGDNCDRRPADTLLSVFLFFLVLLLLFYSLSVFWSLLLLPIMKREGSCWSRFERDSPLLLVLGERCCLDLGLWRRRVTGGVVCVGKTRDK